VTDPTDDTPEAAMRRTALAPTAGLTCLALLITGATAPAQNGGLAPQERILDRVVRAEVIVVGKLGKPEGKAVFATLWPGARAKVEHKVMELTVQEGLRGAKKGDMIRFGFMAPKAKLKGIQTFAAGQECLFFLSKHHGEPFSIAGQGHHAIDRRQDAFAKDLELTRRCLKLLEDPAAGLKAKDAEDRLLTAGMLISRYRHLKPGRDSEETEPIPAAESKQILKILADADWSATVGEGSSWPVKKIAAAAFSQLGVRYEDGLRVEEGADFHAAAQKWVKDNADTYRIRRHKPLADAKDKKQ
jgi:hypothetical protein